MQKKSKTIHIQLPVINRYSTHIIVSKQSPLNDKKRERYPLSNKMMTFNFIDKKKAFY